MKITKKSKIVIVAVAITVAIAVSIAANKAENLTASSGKADKPQAVVAIDPPGD